MMGEQLELMNILQSAQEKGASDIHLAVGEPVRFRVDGSMVRISDTEVSREDMAEILESLLGEAQRAALKNAGQVETACSAGGLQRLRVSVFGAQEGYAMAIRLLSLKIPEPEALGIPKSLLECAAERRGLLLVAGAAGSGRTTTAASLLQRIAAQRERKIVTVEAPVEYLHKSERSMLLQWDIGSDGRTYADALCTLQRQDADVIFVGALRGAETIEAAIRAAETGHLVLANMYANSAAAAVESLTEVFLPEKKQQMRRRLAEVLSGVAVQQLLPGQNAAGRAAAFEVMLASPEICGLIREGKNHQLSSVIQASRRAGMQTMDEAIYELYMKSCIDSDTAVSYAQDRVEMQQKVQLF